jgi:hypothetical protein
MSKEQDREQGEGPLANEQEVQEMVKVEFLVYAPSQDDTANLKVHTSKYMEMGTSSIDDLDTVDVTVREEDAKGESKNDIEAWLNTVPSLLYFQPDPEHPGSSRVWSWPGPPACPSTPFSYTLSTQEMSLHRLYHVGSRKLILVGEAPYGEWHARPLSLASHGHQLQNSIGVSLASITGFCVWPPHQDEVSKQVKTEQEESQSASDQALDASAGNENDPLFLMATAVFNSTYPSESTIHYVDPAKGSHHRMAVPDSSIVGLLYSPKQQCVLGLCRRHCVIYTFKRLPGHANEFPGFSNPFVTWEKGSEQTRLPLYFDQEQAAPEWFTMSPDGYLIVYCTGESRLHVFRENESSPTAAISLEPTGEATITRIVRMGFLDQNTFQIIYKVNLPSKFVEGAVVAHTRVATIPWELGQLQSQGDNKWHCTLQ